MAVSRYRLLLTTVCVVALVALSGCATAGPIELPCRPEAGATGIPTIELSAAGATDGDTFAVMLTGDGGWRRIDEQVTRPIRAAGIPVVGFLTPDFYRTRRTEEESACALERLIRDYAARWKRPRVLLIGYSRGADVLPFMVSRLSPETKQSLRIVAMLGLEREIEFRYHPSWIPFYHPREEEYPVLPEVEKLRGLPLLCVYGSEEDDSLCPSLPAGLATIVREPGRHHFAGRYESIAAQILAAGGIR